MRWSVEVTRLDRKDAPVTSVVDAERWQAALERVRKERGDRAPLSGFNIDVKGEGFTAVNPKARLRYEVRPVNGAKPRASAALEPLYTDVVDATEDRPLFYLERGFLIADADAAAAEAMLRQELERVLDELGTLPGGRFVRLAAFDHRFGDLPERPPVAVAVWKDWAEGLRWSLPPASADVPVATDGSPAAAAAPPAKARPAPEAPVAAVEVPRWSVPPARADVPVADDGARSVAASSLPSSPKTGDLLPAQASVGVNGASVGTATEPAKSEPEPQRAAAKPEPAEVPFALKATEPVAPEVIAAASAALAEKEAAKTAAVAAASAAPVEREAVKTAAVAVTRPNTSNRPSERDSRPSRDGGKKSSKKKKAAERDERKKNATLSGVPGGRASEPGQAPAAAAKATVAAAAPAAAAPAAAAPAAAAASPKRQASPLADAAAAPAKTVPSHAGHGDMLGELFDMFHGIHFHREMIEGLDFAMHVLDEVLPGDGAILHLFDIDQREFIVARATGPSAQALLGQTAPGTDAFLSGVMQMRGARVLGRLADERARARWETLGVAQAGVLCAPILRGMRHLGVLELASTKPETFDNRHAKALDYVCGQIAEFLSSRPMIIDLEEIHSSPTAAH